MKEPAPGLSGSALNLNKHGDTAHFPGTGPKGTNCGSCEYFNTNGFQNKSTKRGRGARVAAMRDIDLKKVRAIYATTPSCKYHQHVV